MRILDNYHMDPREIKLYMMKRLMVEFVIHAHYYYWRVIDYSITDTKLEELFKGCSIIPFDKYYNYILENDLEFYAEGVME